MSRSNLFSHHIDGELVLATTLGPLPKDEVLFHYDCMDLAWASSLPDGRKALVMWADTHDVLHMERYLAFVFDRGLHLKHEVNLLKEGALIRPLLARAVEVYVADVDRARDLPSLDGYQRIALTDCSKLPEGYLPTVDARLFWDNDGQSNQDQQ